MNNLSAQGLLVKWVSSVRQGIRFLDSNRPQVTTIRRSKLEAKEFIRPRKLIALPTGPSVVFFLGLHCSGTSLAKNYLGAAPGLQILKFQPTGFQNALDASQRTRDIVIDKATHNIHYADRIYSSFGDVVGFCCIVRDPRDRLVSLCETNLHREIPRTPRYWEVWRVAYQGYLEAAAALGIRFAHLVRYEDLVQFPLEVKRHFLSNLGVDTVDSTVSSKYEVAFSDDVQDPKLAESNTIRDDTVGRHRHAEPDSRIGALLSSLHKSPETQRAMARFGYCDYGHKHPFLPLDGVIGFDPYGQHSDAQG